MIPLADKIRLFQHILNKLTDAEKENWESKFAIEYTHNSTAIEGNTLSLIETKMVLEDGIAPNEKSLREIDEIRFHHNAFEYIKKQALAKPLDEEIIKDIHERVLPVDGIGGLYRTIPVYIRGAEHVPPNPKRVREFMKFFIEDFQKKQQLEPAEKAAWLHAEFVKIHPFQDGNGRTGRLMMNYSLIGDGYPPTIKLYLILLLILLFLKGKNMRSSIDSIIVSADLLVTLIDLIALCILLHGKKTDMKNVPIFLKINTNVFFYTCSSVHIMHAKF